MTVRNLEHLFRPKSVAIIGASPRPKSLGNLVLANLIDGGFEGAIYPVNPHHAEIAGRKTYSSVDTLPEAPDLAVVCTPPASVPQIIGELGVKGTRAAVVLTAGLTDQMGPSGKTLQIEMLEAARPNLFRVLGPNCLGLIVPELKLNASFAHVPAAPGGLAFVSQSGALCTAMLDWAASREIGFSHVVSLGNSADVDLGDTLDYLARDTGTNAIALYIEGVTYARKFMSALRAAARAKPVVIIKGGRAKAGARAAHSHTGAMAGADNVYEAAFRRAGALRVQSIDELFDAIETLAHRRTIKGERLAILTNGGGPGVLAADAVALAGGKLAVLSGETTAELDKVLPATWSRANPIDIIGDAPPDRFCEAAKILSRSPDVDAILFSYAPTAVSNSREVAQATVSAFAGQATPVFANWLGGSSTEEARRLFEAAHIPTFETPERAARAFLNLVEYRRNQTALMEVASTDGNPQIDRPAATATISATISDGRTMLSEAEAKTVLTAYGIPTVRTVTAQNSDEALTKAKELGFPVALKLLSQDISHKSDVGGVVLDIGNEVELRVAAETIRRRLHESQPAARFDGFTVQQMIHRPKAIELIVGAAIDPTFGPILLVGHGGTATEVIKDISIGLPPLNSVLARDMISRTKVADLLAGYRDVPAAKLDSVALVLLQLSQLVAENPEITEVDINPLIADADGVVALDARIRVSKSVNVDPRARLAILPYPEELREIVGLDDNLIVLRPIRPEDEWAHKQFLSNADPDDLRLRFFGTLAPFKHEDLARLTQIDYDREMAFIASDESDEPHRTLGVVRAVTDPDNIAAEFAIIVESGHKSQGLGTVLMNKMIAYLRGRGTKRIEGQILAENHKMLSFARSLGFREKLIGPGVVLATLDLD